MRRTVPFQTVLILRDREYSAFAEILPGRQAPHVAQDSPRYFDPPELDKVARLSLRDDEGNPAHLTPAQWHAAEAQVLGEWQLDREAETWPEVTA